jgi:hypothetical protein
MGAESQPRPGQLHSPRVVRSRFIVARAGRMRRNSSTTADAKLGSKPGGTIVATEAALLLGAHTENPARECVVGCGSAARCFVVGLVAYLDTYQEL